MVCVIESLLKLLAKSWNWFLGCRLQLPVSPPGELWFGSFFTHLLRTGK